MKVNKADVFEAFKNGGKLLGELVVDAYGESINQIGEQAFSDAIEVGIQNTIAALYDANVSDNEILRVVVEHWGLDKNEVEDRLVWEKKESTFRSLKQHLKLQGYTTAEINSFIKDYNAKLKINHSNELWKFKNNPEKLIKEIKTKK